MPDHSFWKDRRVLVTGHTGFKGSWLCFWLNIMGAKVSGYALEPPTKPSLFEQLQLEHDMASIIGDVRDLEKVSRVFEESRPEVVIHMAAQSLVRPSYEDPVLTYGVNLMGTVHILEAARGRKDLKAVLIVTTDKCYENREWNWAYRENEPMGGFDPYSSSKACAELATAAYRNSFFENRPGPAVASARAGNVIGGGDRARDRLVPDCLHALLTDTPLILRNPAAVRPWQHVLEPLSGYLRLVEALWARPEEHARAYNFGPGVESERSVEWVSRRLYETYGSEFRYEMPEGAQPHEAHSLKLDSAEARVRLGWNPRWDLRTALEKIVDWTKVERDEGDLRAVTREHIEAYQLAGD